MAASNGEMLPYPNGGRFYRRTQPMLLPTEMSSFNTSIRFGFDASGAAGSATARIKLFYARMGHAYTA
jgi:hypothetical protein